MEYLGRAALVVALVCQAEGGQLMLAWGNQGGEEGVPTLPEVLHIFGVDVEVECEVSAAHLDGTLLVIDGACAVDGVISWPLAYVRPPPHLRLTALGDAEAVLGQVHSVETVAVARNEVSCGMEYAGDDAKVLGEGQREDAVAEGEADAAAGDKAEAVGLT